MRGRGGIRAAALTAAAALTMMAGTAGAAHAGVIVSVGDSYSSGEGAAPYDFDSDSKSANHKCHRSSLGWPRLVGVTQVHHLACSGAVIDNIETKPQTDQVPDNVVQLTRLGWISQRTSIDRVVLTIGGNDAPINFASRLGSCAVGLPCLADSGKIVQQIPKLQARLEKVYRETQIASGGAPLLVVGYPDLYPAPGANLVKIGLHCPQFDVTALPRFAYVERALEAAMQRAAAAVGADYLSMRNVLAGHQLCTGKSYIRALIGKPGDLTKDQQQGHPLKEGQTLMALRVLNWLAQHRRTCTPASSVQAIVDDSGSMSRTDPDNIRRRALELLLTKPDNQTRTFGADEFATTAGALFAPGLVGPNQAAMIGSLDALQADGFDGGGDSTDYNAAFAQAAADQPGAAARIFLTDGGHNEGTYDNGHLGGPPTFVIGLGIGPADGTNNDADTLQRIASDTGGRYYPLLQDASDDTATQTARLQPALNDIESSIGCNNVQIEQTQTLAAPNRLSAPVQTVLPNEPGVEIVVSWPDPGTQVHLGTLTVRNRQGKVIADLAGTRRIVRSKKKRTKILPSVVQGQTFQTITIPRPPGGRVIAATVAASTLPAPTDVTVQIRPVAQVGPAQGTTQTIPVDPGTGPRPGPVTNPVVTPAPPTATGLTASSPTYNTVDVAYNVAWAAGRDPVVCHLFQDGIQVSSGACAARATAHLTSVAAGHHNYTASVTDNRSVTGPLSNSAGVDVTNPPPPPARVNAYDNYGGAGVVGHAMCRGNPANSLSMPGGSVNQTFTVPAGVASLDTATVQIDPDASVTAHMTLYVNGAQRAAVNAAAAGDTVFSFPSTPVSAGQTVQLSISFTASSGKIITVYTVGGGRGTFSTSNSCPAGADNTSTTGTALRAVLAGYDR